MEGENTKPKILIFGGTGYLGKYMVKASVSSGHNTFVYARPVTENSRTSKLEIHKEFQAYPQFLDQLKIVDAIKVAGNIKVFV
ncbi:hypothetical protein WN943_015288 [Citrus x changshan-huyou]